MGKQNFNRIKKTLNILLIVFFVAELATPAISAYQPHYSYNSIENYEPTLFHTEQAAQHQCLYDTVV